MITQQQPSEESLTALMALKSAVDKALEKKMKLGQFAVIWKNGRTEIIPVNNSPVNTEPFSVDYSKSVLSIKAEHKKNL